MSMIDIRPEQGQTHKSQINMPKYLQACKTNNLIDQQPRVE